MKTPTVLVPPMLLALVQSIAAVGIPSTYTQNKNAQVSNRTFSIYGMINEPNLPFDIYADTALGVWVNSDRVPDRGYSPNFILDPSTNTVVIENALGSPEQIVYLGSDGRWLVKNSTNQAAIKEVSRKFKINIVDNTQELQAYSSSGQVLSQTFKCMDSKTGTFPIFSNSIGQPQSCIGEPLTIIVR